MITHHQRIPKQVTKAPSGAAVSSMPFHVADVPLESAMIADLMADKALEEAKEMHELIKRCLEAERLSWARFYWVKAVELRRIYQAFTKAVDVMGGL